jgi:methyl-accepting chemotaxis protein
MPTYLIIIAAGALIAVAALCFYLIVFIKSVGKSSAGLINHITGLITHVTKTLDVLTGEIASIRMQLNEALDHVDVLSEQAQATLTQVNSSVEQVNVQLKDVGEIVDNVKQISNDATRISEDATEVIHGARTVVVSLMDLEQNIQRKVTSPIVEITTVFSAIGRGIRVFRKKVGSDPAPIRQIPARTFVEH